MKSCITSALAIALLCAQSSLLAESAPSSVSTPEPLLHQKKLTKDISLQYSDIQKKGDDSKQEIVLTNPHLFIMDSSAMVPAILAEANLEGVLKLLMDQKAHRIESESQGVSRLLLASQDADKPAMVFTVDGNIKKTVDVDPKLLESILPKLRAGQVLEESFLSVLFAIKTLSVEGKDLKVVGFDGNAKQPKLVELLKLDYSNPGLGGAKELDLKLNLKDSLDFSWGANLYEWPDAEKMEMEYEAKIKIPGKSDADWRAMLEGSNFSHSAGTSGEFKSRGKSSFGKGAWEGSFVVKSSLGASNHVEGQWHYEADLAGDWVKRWQGIVKSPLAKPSADDFKSALGLGIESTVFKWIKSPRSTPFLSALPTKIVSDWSGSMLFVAEPDFTPEKFSFKYSLLGAEKQGLFVDMQYEKDAVLMKISLLGGKVLYSHLVALYNLFTDSIVDQYPLPKFSKEAQDKLLSILLEYVDQPGKADSELTFIINASQEGVKIGGKNIDQLGEKLLRFFGESISQQGNQIELN